MNEITCVCGNDFDRRCHICNAKLCHMCTNDIILSSLASIVFVDLCDRCSNFLDEDLFFDNFEDTEEKEE